MTHFEEVNVYVEQFQNKKISFVLINSIMSNFNDLHIFINGKGHIPNFIVGHTG